MKKTLTRSLSILLSVLLLLGSLSILAFAAPLQQVAVEVSLEYIGYWEDNAHYFAVANTFPALQDLDGLVTYKWTVLDEDGEDTEITGSGRFLEFTLTPGVYKISCTVTVTTEGSVPVTSNVVTKNVPSHTVYGELEDLYYTAQYLLGVWYEDWYWDDETGEEYYEEIFLPFLYADGTELALKEAIDEARALLDEQINDWESGYPIIPQATIDAAIAKLQAAIDGLVPLTADVEAYFNLRREAYRQLGYYWWDDEGYAYYYTDWTEESQQNLYDALNAAEDLVGSPYTNEFNGASTVLQATLDEAMALIQAGIDGLVEYDYNNGYDPEYGFQGFGDGILGRIGNVLVEWFARLLSILALLLPGNFPSGYQVVDFVAELTKGNFPDLDDVKYFFNHLF
ncbi:MAG: hypothetical protein LBN05_03935 [Oscillospiraceae bacterium]|jgi:hypothetical protein|nr:hypothetical protein [Oscillospiraceae bacterium]